MSEVDERWLRDNRFLKRLTSYGVVVSALLWPISYYASFPAAESGHGVWFAWISGLTLAGATVSTIGTVIGCGIALTDEPPLAGANQ